MAVGRQALKELVDHPHETSVASLVFEDGWREVSPSEMQYLADYLRDSRGFFQERGHLQRMVQWLEDKPVYDAVQRAEAKIAKLLSGAWRAGLLSHEDEEYMPILKHLPNHIRYGLQRVQEGFPRPFIRRQVIEQSFRLTPRTPEGPVLRLAKHVADVIYEEGKRLPP